MRNFQGIVFYMNTNLWGDFQICISVPLITDPTYVANKWKV